MESKLLESYLAVVDAGSIAEAARRLDLAPTTIAQQIKTLEADLGTRLLVRSGRTVKPAPAGVRIIERSREMVRLAKNLRSEASDTALPTGPLRLGATPTTLTGILLSAFREWNKKYKDIQIFIELGTSMMLMSKVISGELDAAIIVHPAFPLSKTCEWLELRKENLILLTPARMKVTDPLLTIAREPFIRYDRGVAAGKLAFEYLRRHNIRPQVQFELEGIEHIAKFVAGGLGVSILPDWATTGPKETTVRRWKLPPPCPSRTVGLLWLRSSSRSQLSAALAAVLRTTVSA